jgi:uncharacterized protein (TIGR02996 family)
VTDQDFLAAIIASSKDDAPRLIYADWLEEQGNSQRAEFIRVQCELAQIGRERKLVKGTIRAKKDGSGYRFWQSHENEEQARIVLHPGDRIDVEAWGPRTGSEEKCSGLLVLGEVSHNLAEYLLKRDALSIPYPVARAKTLLAWEHEQFAFHQDVIQKWLGVPGFINYASHETPQVTDNFIMWSRGFPRSTTVTERNWIELGPALVRVAPLEEVRLIDKRASRQGIRWFDESMLPHHPDDEEWDLDDIDRRIFEFLPGEDDMGWKTFSSPADALEALSQACLAYARGQK